MSTYCFNIDWLSVSYKYDFERGFPMQKGWRFVELSKTNIYKRRAVVMNEEGNKLLTLLWDPISSILKSDLVLVEFANATLYDGSYVLLMNFLECEGFVFNNVSRLDLCIDYEMHDIERKVVTGLASNLFHVKRSQRGAIFYAQSGTDRDFVQLSWGAKESSIKMKTYNKSRELKEVGDKPYIRRCWRDCGFNEDNVWRWEISLTSVSSMQYDGNKLSADMVKDYNCMLHMVSNLYNNKFIVLDDGGNNIFFLDIEYNGSNCYCKHVGGSGVASSPVCSVINGLMKQYNTLEMAVMGSARKDLLLCVQKIVRLNKLEHWFECVYGTSVYCLESERYQYYKENYGYDIYKFKIS